MSYEYVDDCTSSHPHTHTHTALFKVISGGQSSIDLGQLTSFLEQVMTIGQSVSETPFCSLRAVDVCARECFRKVLVCEQCVSDVWACEGCEEWACEGCAVVCEEWACEGCAVVCEEWACEGCVRSGHVKGVQLCVRSVQLCVCECEWVCRCLGCVGERESSRKVCKSYCRVVIFIEL